MSREYFAIERQQPIRADVGKKRTRKILLASLWRTVAVAQTQRDAEAIVSALSAASPDLEFRIKSRHQLDAK